MLATTFSIVAVFLPIGFMGGIIGKFFHEFGVTIVAAVLISMFVSFTLDPMLSSIWHDPEIEAHGKPKANAELLRQDHRPRHRLVRPRHRSRWSTPTRASCAGRWRTSWRRWCWQSRVFATSVVMVPLLGTEFVPKADFSETSVNFYTPVGSSLEATEAKARQVEAIVREFPEVQYTLSTINTGNAPGKMYASVYVRLVDRKERSRSVDQMSERAARAAASRCPASPSRTWACSMPSAATSRWSSRCRAPT